ncbi:unnamed protein product [Owenia fusiformis]|uniref:YTH domain-containing protein n=1 Tax=Owenia fusiformis TaxID=6347 RepID=A0A8S4N029_OWEFU|nr:unnamed protein product [Owenia fusiformis]
MSEALIDENKDEIDADLNFLDNILDHQVDEEFEADSQKAKKHSKTKLNGAKKRKSEGTMDVDGEEKDKKLKDMERRRKQLEKENKEREETLRKLKMEEELLKSPDDHDDEVNMDLGDDLGGETIKGYDTRSEAGSGFSESSLSESENDEKPEGNRSRADSNRSISPIAFPERDESEDVAAAEAESKPVEESTSNVTAGVAQGRYLKYMFRDARFYLIKSNNSENVALAKAKGVWSTPPQNEQKLNNAYREHKNVILIFSVKESGKFQGYARVAALSDKDHPPIRWVLPPGMTARALSGVFKLDWINRRELPFTKVGHLRNPWNNGKPLKIGRDGQDIEPSVGEELCRLFPVDENIEITTIARKAKHAKALGRDYGRERMNRGHVEYRRRGHDRRGGGGRSGYAPSRRDDRYDPYHGSKDRRRDRSPRSSYSSRPSHDAILNGSYNDYLRDFARTGMMPPSGPPGYGPPPPSYAMDPIYGYDRPPPPRDSYWTSPDIASHRRTSEKRYEADVDDFLRRTTSSHSGHSSRDRSTRDRDSRR